MAGESSAKTIFVLRIEEIPENLFIDGLQIGNEETGLVIFRFVNCPHEQILQSMIIANFVLPCRRNGYLWVARIDQFPLKL